MTKITVGEADSNYGVKKVFDLTAVAELPKDKVIQVLRLAKDNQDNFSKKFDWSLKASVPQQAAQPIPNGVLPFESAPTQETQQPTQQQAAPIPTQEPPKQDFSFDDINF